MKRYWWRVLAQRIAYPKWWPTCHAFFQPMGDEKYPPEIGMSINGHTVWYRLK